MLSKEDRRALAHIRAYDPPNARVHAVWIEDKTACGLRLDGYHGAFYERVDEPVTCKRCKRRA